jgi:O-6-methylguanine DNA methyltransferase
VVESEFQRLTMQKLRQVRAGAVTTYHALAAAIGHPDSQRAVGNTMATNPIAIFIPCHRVIRSDGTIGNYGGGVDRKIMLLRAEGFAMEEQPKLPQGSVLGHSRTHIFCRPECPAARRADPARSLIYADAAKAAAAGLRACKICKPT